MDTRAALAALTILGATGCAVTSAEVTPSALGKAVDASALLAVIDQPGPVTVETVASADWTVNRGGLINLDHPRAKAAGLDDGPEPIRVYFHVLRHPERGDYLVDTGVERALRDDPDHAALRGLVASVMHTDGMKYRAPLGDWLRDHSDVKVKGVFLTHLHPDHVTGMRDAPDDAVVYLGPNEAGARALENVFVSGVVDRALEHKKVEALAFEADATGRFRGVSDLFGDGSVLALWVPGHTAGSVAFVARTPTGPVLITGDACHTRWGWDHDVEPGTFSSDVPESAVSLGALRRLASEHPALSVRLGHQ